MFPKTQTATLPTLSPAPTLPKHGPPRQLQLSSDGSRATLVCALATDRLFSKSCPVSSFVHSFSQSFIHSLGQNHLRKATLCLQEAACYRCIKELQWGNPRAPIRSSQDEKTSGGQRSRCRGRNLKPQGFGFLLPFFSHLSWRQEILYSQTIDQTKSSRFSLMQANWLPLVFMLPSILWSCCMCLQI